MTLSNAVSTEIDNELLRRFGEPEPGTSRRFIPEERLSEAYVHADALRAAAQTIEDAVEVLRSNRFRSSIMVAALQQLHPVELDEIALRLGMAVAAKDPSGTDGRYGQRLQALAEPFRS